MKKSLLFAAKVLFVVVLVACGGGPGVTTGGNKITPTITWPTPVAITYGTALSSTQLNATASVVGSYVYDPASGTVPTAGTHTLSVSFTPTDTTNYYTAYGSVQLTVNKATPTVLVWPTSASAITSGQTLASSTLVGVCTATVPGTCAWTTPTTVPPVGTDPEGVTFTPTDSTNYTTVTGSVSVVVNTPTPTLTSITFADGRPVKYCVGQCGIFPITITGTNFTTGQTVSCTPDSDIQLVMLNNSTQLTVVIAIDATHQGSGARSCKVCKSDGTGCSATAQFGLYGQNMATVSTTSGEKFLINSQEVVAGQNSGANGYVDKFVKTTGAPDGKCFVGYSWVNVAADNLTGLFTVDGNPRDPNTCEISLTVPAPAGGSLQGATIIKVQNSRVVALQPAATHKMSCVSWIGQARTNNPVMLNDVGTSPQSLAMGGNTYAYSYDASGQALYKTDASTCTTTINLSVVGITANAPDGTEIVTFDPLGLGALVSYGDNSVTVFSESSMRATTTIASTGMPAGKIPISMIAVGNYAVIGNSDGTFTKVDPSAGTAALISGASVSFMPVGLVPAVPADGKGSAGFWACPQDGTACLFFAL